MTHANTDCLLASAPVQRTLPGVGWHRGGVVVGPQGGATTCTLFVSVARVGPVFMVPFGCFQVLFRTLRPVETELLGFSELRMHVGKMQSAE